MVNIDPDKLYTVANKNETSRSLFKSFAERERDPQKNELIIERMEEVMRWQRLKFNALEIKAVFFDLEKLGMGKVKGKVFAISEGISVKHMGQVYTMRAQEAPSKIPTHTTDRRSQASRLIPLSNQPDRLFSAAFPNDITAQELEFVCAFIKRTLG